MKQLGRVIERRLNAANRIAKPLGFHVWLSSAGHVYATHVYSRAEIAALARRFGNLPVPGGLTLDAPTIPAMQRVLLKQASQ